MNETKELATVENREVVTELSITDVKNQVVKIQQLMNEVLHEGQHYGVIPGTEKPSLLKPGAEKINFMFRIGTGKLEIVKLDFENGHREITVTTPIIHIPTNTILAYGIGSCSTMESKYRYRNGTKKCPACGKETIIKGKEEYGGGWLCYAKKGGCGAKYKENDPVITSQVVGKIENPDIADVYNTVLKIAAKRSYVDGTIKASAASDFFTQDIEDFVEDEPPAVMPKTQDKPVPKSVVKPSSETIADVFSGTIEDVEPTQTDTQSTMNGILSTITNNREKAIYTVKHYLKTGLILTKDKETADKMVEWLENQPKAEEQKKNWDKVIENIKLFESSIPEQGQVTHGLYVKETKQNEIF